MQHSPRAVHPLSQQSFAPLRVPVIRSNISLHPSHKYSTVGLGVLPSPPRAHCALHTAGLSAATRVAGGGLRAGRHSLGAKTPKGLLTSTGASEGPA